RTRHWNWKPSRRRPEFAAQNCSTPNLNSGLMGGTLAAHLFAVSGHFGADTARIESRQISFHRPCQQSDVRDFAEIFGDEPDRLITRHPIQSIEAREVYRTRVAAECALESQIEINIEVAHRQLAQRAINRFAITAAGKV